MTKLITILAALVLTACGGQPADKSAAVAVVLAPASAVAPVVSPAASASAALTKEDVAAMLDAARADTANQILAAQSEKAAADKAAGEKQAVERRIQRAERAAAQAKAEAAKPVFADIPRRACEQKQVTVQIEVPDVIKPQERNALGMLAGAAAGALLGNQVGGGQGRTLATVGAAAAGAWAGDSMANPNAQVKPGTHLENRTVTTEVCHDVVDHIRVR